jgi:hypothetical protein
MLRKIQIGMHLLYLPGADPSVAKGVHWLPGTFFCFFCKTTNVHHMAYGEQVSFLRISEFYNKFLFWGSPSFIDAMCVCRDICFSTVLENVSGETSESLP